MSTCTLRCINAVRIFLSVVTRRLSVTAWSFEQGSVNIAMLAQRTPRDQPLGPWLSRSKLFFSDSARLRASYEVLQGTLVQGWQAYLEFLYLREGR